MVEKEKLKKKKCKPQNVLVWVQKCVEHAGTHIEHSRIPISLLEFNRHIICSVIVCPLAWIRWR